MRCRKRQWFYKRKCYLHLHSYQARSGGNKKFNNKEAFNLNKRLKRRHVNVDNNIYIYIYIYIGINYYSNFNSYCANAPVDLQGCNYPVIPDMVPIKYTGREDFDANATEEEIEN